MKNSIKRKALIGGSLSLSALLFACGGAGDTTASDSPYATVTGTVSSSSTGALSTTGIDIGNVNLSFIAAVAIDNGKIVYTADDIDDNGNFNLKLKEGLDYAFILFDISKKPKLIVKDPNGNAIKINGDGSINISVSDSDGDGTPDTASVKVSGSLTVLSDPDLDDKDGDHYPDGIETIDTGGSPNPDYDEDGDGYFDGIEDNDGDEKLDGHEDSNNNGIPDVYEDDDNDGLPNYLDDTDGDGYPDHIDEDDNDYYKYEMKGMVSTIDKEAGTFKFTYNETVYDVSVTDTTTCEINDRYYRGTDCLNHLTDGAYIELKTSDDITASTNITATKFEIEDEGYEDNYSDDYHRYEIYGTVSNIDKDKGTFVFNWSNNITFNVTVSNNTTCEINDRYYRGPDCLSILSDNICIELKTSDDVYSGNITDITAIEFEISDDCQISY